MGFVEQAGNAITFEVFMQAPTTGFGVTGLVLASALKVDVFDPSGTQIATNDTPTEDGDGFYRYTLLGTNTSTVGEYKAVFKNTNAACYPAHVPVIWSVGRDWIANIDTTVSSRSNITPANVWTYSQRELTDYGIAISDPVTTPTVNVTGGGSTGGSLQAGSYYLKYTFTNAAGETLASPLSLRFTVASGNIPQVTLPSLVSGATGINLYVTATNGPPGSETLYATGIVTTTYNLSSAVSSGGVFSVTVTNSGSGYSGTPTVSFSGGGGSGATATATVVSNQITVITVTASGSGYTSAPTITISGGGGASGAATANLFTAQPLAPNVNTTNTLVNSIWTASSRTLSSFAFNVTVASNLDKTGYQLAANGLDVISVSDPGGMTNLSTLPKMLVALFRYFYKQTTATATQLQTYADDNTTVNVTMSLSNNGTVQTKGAGA